MSSTGGTIAGCPRCSAVEADAPAQCYVAGVKLGSRLSLLPLLLAFACEGEAAPEPKGGQEPAAEVKDDAPASDEAKPATELQPDGTKQFDIKSLDPPKITLLEAGKDPQPLRLKPTVGVREGLKMTMLMEMEMAGAPKVTLPPIVTRAASTADRVEGDRIFATLEFESMTVEPKADTQKAMVDQLNSSLAGFEAFRGKLEMNDQGALRGGSVNVPQNLPGPLQQTVNQMQESFGKIQVPFPTEAVGVGGKWVAVATLEQGGLELEQTSTYELVRREGDELEVKFRVEQKLLSETFSPPGVPGVEGTIKRHKAGGGGTTTLALGSLVPTRSSMKIDVDMAMTIEAMGQTQDQELKMGILIGLERTE